MELLYANRDPLLEFSDTLAQWYGGLQTERREQRKLMRRPRGKYPADSSPCWTVHVMDGSDAGPAAGGLRRAGLPLSELSECLELW